jgi:hypothetical protein
MKQKILVLLDGTPKSLSFQHELLMNSHKWNSNFDVTFAYVSPLLENCEIVYSSNELNNNQYTYLEIVDKAFSDNLNIDNAILFATKMMLQVNELKILMISDEKVLSDTAKGFDMVLFQQTCFGCKIREWAMNHLLSIGLPFYITTDFNINEVKESYFLFTGSDDNTKAIKQYIYLFDKSIEHQMIHLISIVNPSGMQHEKVIYDYIRSRFNKVMVQRLYIEDTPSFYKKILSKGKEHSIVTHKNHTDFVNYFSHKSKALGDDVLANIFISQ